MATTGQDNNSLYKFVMLFWAVYLLIINIIPEDFLKVAPPEWDLNEQFSLFVMGIGSKNYEEIPYCNKSRGGLEN